MCEAKAERFNRELQVISRWQPTSQYCSACGFKWGKLDLSVRELVPFQETLKRLLLSMQQKIRLTFSSWVRPGIAGFAV
jgi:hypothetical protein